MTGAISGQVSSQRGIKANDKIFERILRLTESSRFDPVYMATKFDDPPPGEIPYMNVAKASTYVILKALSAFIIACNQ